jgi:hypothetical protein
VYRIHSRNLSVGVYRAAVKGFIGIRVKFGSHYLFTEYHYDTGAPFGTVRPRAQIGVLPDDIPCCEFAQHEFGSDSFATDPATNIERPVIRRDLAEGEQPHGTRMGFVHEWADTRERLPDTVYPHIKQNQKLFEFLDNLVSVN